MANLIYRAERAVLGALLRDPDALDDIRFLAADDFASGQHRDVFRAIAAAHAQAPGDSQAPFEFAVAFSAPLPGISVRYLQALSGTCPDPAHVRAYARMVMESALRRQLLVHADRLFREAGDLHFEVGRFSKAAPPGNGVQEFAVHLMKLAHAVWTNARTFGPGAEIPNDRQPAAGPDETAVPDASASYPVTAMAAAADERARQEDDVLAGLIQHHWQNSNVLDWLPADAFTAGPRRDVYEAVAALGRAGQPIDELTVAWHLAADRSASPAIPEPPPAGARAMTRSLAELIGYVGLLAALPVADGVATMTGRALLDRHAKAAASSPAPGASATGGSRAPAVAASPDQRPQAPAAQSGGTPTTVPPQSFGASPSRPPDLPGPPPAGPRQPGPLPRP